MDVVGKEEEGRKLSESSKRAAWNGMLNTVTSRSWWHEASMSGLANGDQRNVRHTCRFVRFQHRRETTNEAEWERQQSKDIPSQRPSSGHPTTNITISRAKIEKK
jgi:hypothetical protein